MAKHDQLLKSTINLTPMPPNELDTIIGGDAGDILHRLTFYYQDGSGIRPTLPHILAIRGRDIADKLGLTRVRDILDSYDQELVRTGNHVLFVAPQWQGGSIR